MNTITKSDLPELDAAQQRLFAVTAGMGRGIPVRFGNDLWRLQCTAAHVPWNPEVSIPLRIVGEDAVLEIAFTPGGNLFNRHAEYHEVTSLSEVFALAIRTTLNRELLDSLQTALDAGVEIATTPILTAPPLALAFDVWDAADTREARGILHIGPQVLARIEALAPSWTSAPQPDLARLPQSVALCVAKMDLPANELADLRAGDCLILGEAASWPFPLWISTGSGVVSSGLPPTASQPPLLDFKKQPNMNTQNTDSGVTPASISSLRLPVLVVAGRKDMTLEELAGLREGAAIEIGNGEDIPVELQVNNQIVATGRLVRVADKICASITEIRSSTSA